MKHMQTLGFLLSLALFNVAYASGKPEAFFNRYIELGDSFDPSLASLYSDSARIRAYRVYPHGLERSMELTGVQWKQLATKLMPMAKAQKMIRVHIPIPLLRNKVMDIRSRRIATPFVSAIQIRAIT